MKKGISLREIVLLGVLLVVIFYYFVVQIPITNEMNAISAEKAGLMDEVDTKTAMLVTQKSMQKALDEVYAQNGGQPDEMPAYDNSDALLEELNTVLASAETYSINFKAEDRETSAYVVRRVLQLSYNTATYWMAEHILDEIAASPYESLISDLSISDNTKKSAKGDALVNVSLTLTYFEYVQAENEASAS
jgi:Tfp pilus assembly protein PilO